MAALAQDVAMMGLQAATLRVGRVEACDKALSHLGQSFKTSAIHAAASQLRMPVLAGVSPLAQSLLLSAMPELRGLQPGARPFGMPLACPGTHLMPTITPDKALKVQVRHSTEGKARSSGHGSVPAAAGMGGGGRPP